MPREGLSDVALGQRYCLPAIRRPERSRCVPKEAIDVAFREAFAQVVQNFKGLKGFEGFSGF